MKKLQTIINNWINEETAAKECQAAGVGISTKNADAAVRLGMLLSVRDQVCKMMERNA